MTVYLVALVYYMDPATRKVELLWQDHIPQVSIEQCHEIFLRRKTVAKYLKIAYKKI